MEVGTIQGESPVRGFFFIQDVRSVFKESCCLGLQRQVGGKFHLKLNIDERPIVEKYCEGKMKRTLKRE